MKYEKLLTGVTGGVLAFCLSWAAGNCLVTAFGLPLLAPLAPVCALLALVSAALLSLPWGGSLLLCLWALGFGFIHREGTALGQLWQLLHRLSDIYNRAYGSGVLLLPEEMDQFTVFDWPLWIWAALICGAVCRSVCCRKPAWPGVAVTLLPLGSCIVVTDTVPGELWLALVLGGLVLLVLPALVRQENGAQALRLTAMTALPLAAALTALFLLWPQDGYVNHSEKLRNQILTALREVPRQMVTGAADLVTQLPGEQRQIDLASLGPRITLTQPVLEIRGERSGVLYLRQQDFDRYDGRGWQATESRQEVFSPASEDREALTVLPLNRKNLRLLPYYPGETVPLSGGSPEMAPMDREYTLIRTHLPRNWRQTAYTGTSLSDQWRSYCTLPEDTRREARTLLAGLWSEAATNTEKADIIAALVTEAAVYDLDPSRMPASEPDFALWFLREADSGYCVHFATAATVLLRAAEVPARYVTGYMTDLRAGETVTVTEENAHAWAEYYEPNLDLWLPLEATPATEEALPELQPLPPEATVPRETMAAEPEPSTAPAAPAAPTEAAPTGPVQPPEAPDLPSGEDKTAFPVLPFLLLPLLALLLWLQRSLRLALRRRRQRRGTVNAQALARWQESERLARLLKEHPPAELMELAQKAKFSQHELTGEELEAFDRFNGRCLRALRKKPWYLRLIWQYVCAAY